MVFDNIPIIDLIRRTTSNGGVYSQNGKVMVTPVGGMQLFSKPVRLDAITALVCLKGEIDCSINLKNYKIEENNLFMCFSGDIIQIHSAENVEGYALLLSSDYLDELHIDLSIRADTYMTVRNNACIKLPHEEIMELAPYFVLLQKHLNNNNPHIVRGLVLALTHTLISLRREYISQKSLDIPVGETRAQQIFDRFIFLLDTYHTKERCLKFYADKMALTPKYMSLMVKKVSGRNALEWLNEYVIMEAKLLLDYTDFTVQEIAYRLNFPTQSSFGKYFKQQVGISPKSYRHASGK